MSVQEIEERFAELEDLQQKAYDETVQLYNVEEEPPQADPNSTTYDDYHPPQLDDTYPPGIEDWMGFPL